MIIPAASRSASLVFVGLGTRSFGQLTVEAIAHMKNAQKLLYLAVEPVGEQVARDLNPAGFESLSGFYAEGKPRRETYREIIAAILGHVRAGRRTCVATYGHPGVFAHLSHHSIKVARTEGFGAIMLPGISAEDCLIADLGVDPGVEGLSSFEATEFLLRARKPDPSVPLLLWQVGFVGIRTTPGMKDGPSPYLPLLVEHLKATYPPGHLVTLYEAATLPGTGPTIQEVPLSALARTPFSVMATLYVPPAHHAGFDAEMLKRMAEMAPPPAKAG